MVAPGLGQEADPAAVVIPVDPTAALQAAGVDIRVVDAARLRIDAEAAAKASRHAEAIQGFEQAESLLLQALGPADPEVYEARNRLALALLAGGRAPEAAALLQGLAELWQARDGEAAPATLTARHNLALALTQSGRADAALLLIAQVATAREATLGAMHADTLTSRGEQASILATLGRHAEAQRVEEQVLPLRLAVLGDRDPATLASMNNLAESLVSLGRYAEALPLHERAYRTRRQVLGERHPLTLASLNNLATTYEYLGRLDDALDLHRTLVGQYTQVLGERHPDTLTSLSNFAQALARSGRSAEAVQQQERILRIRTETLGERHPATVASLGSLAAGYFAAGRYADALPYAERALLAANEVLGEGHPDAVRAKENLATLYFYTGRMPEALPLFEAALSGYGAALGDGHPSTVSVMPYLAQLYYLQGKRPEGLAMYERLITAVERMRKSGDLSAENRQALFARWVGAYKTFVRLLVNEGAHVRAFEVVELSKARTLLESSAMRRANQSGVLDAGESAQVQGLETRIAAVGERIAAAFDQPDQKLALEIERNRLVEGLAALRRQLEGKYPKYAALNDVQILGASAATGLLDADTVFVNYLTLGDTVLAFTVDNTGKVEGQVVGQVTDLARSIEAFRTLISHPGGATALMAQGKRIWRLTDGSHTIALNAPNKAAVWVRDPDELARSLGQQLVGPLLPRLKDKRHWILSPEGPLTLLPFETLLLGTDRVVAGHDVSYSQSLSMLALLRQRERDYAALGARRQLFAVGGARYSEHLEGMSPETAELLRGPTAVAGRTETPVEQAFRSLNVAWDELPASEREVEAIAALFDPSQSVVLKGDAASEARLTELNQTRELAQFKYLLFSTHGYLSTAEPALSAVVLNQLRKDQQTDGYVTASEWTRYDLQSDLIVLSACETGVGKVVQGEGVTGLPYALYVAGNRNTLLSLWPVVDDSTEQFMVRLFERLRAGEDQVSALNAVKRSFLNEAGGKWVAPVFWAPFVLYGG
jgi:CHAT domain-containing protein/tetratricopeptide (TPR) repeat protein